MSDYEKLAERCIRQHVDDLTTDLRKRWPEGLVEIGFLATGEKVRAVLRRAPNDYVTSRFAYGATLEECVARAAKVIAEIPDPSPWFDPSHPINLPDAAHDYACIKRSYERGDITGETALSLLREIGHDGAPWLTEAA